MGCDERNTRTVDTVPVEEAQTPSVAQGRSRVPGVDSVRPARGGIVRVCKALHVHLGKVERGHNGRRADLRDVGKDEEDSREEGEEGRAIDAVFAAHFGDVWIDLRSR
jgi:hypothetical protein